jgi:nitrite reductase/ring-hydroxylating ferredoxin subunit
MVNPAPVIDSASGASIREEHWLQRWYPVAYLQDLDPRRPTAFTLLEMDLVLWWDAAGQQWCAFADVCPHRLVPLSEGRLNERGELECPYHGWSFNAQGSCTAIPQAEAAIGAIPRSSCRRYATASAQGLLCVFAGDPAAAAAVPLPLVPVLEENGYSPAKNFAAKQRWLPEDERDAERNSKSAANPKPAPSAVLKPLPVPDLSIHQMQEAPETEQQDSLVPVEKAEDSGVIKKTMDMHALECFMKTLDELEAFLKGGQVEFLSEELKEKIGAKLAALNLAAICGGITPRMN